MSLRAKDLLPDISLVQGTVPSLKAKSVQKTKQPDWNLAAKTNLYAISYEAALEAARELV